LNYVRRAARNERAREALVHLAWMLIETRDKTSEIYHIKELPSGSRGAVDISVRQQRHLAFIHRPRKNGLNGHNQCA